MIQKSARITRLKCFGLQCTVCFDLACFDRRGLSHQRQKYIENDLKGMKVASSYLEI